ncbi:MAG: ABC transporter permease [Planctomycetota bacterium]
MTTQKDSGILKWLAYQLLPPLMAKDLKMSLRTRRAALLQLLFLGVCFVSTWALWPEEGVYSLSSQDAHYLFTVLGIGQLALVALFAPAFTSPAITMEKERNTFDLLYGTLMSPINIMWGKIGGSLAFLMLVVLSSIPVVSICLVLGGIDLTQLVWFYALLFITAVFFGMIGLTVSALCQKTFIAIIVSYIIIGFASAVTIIPSVMFFSTLSGNARRILNVVWSISPFVAMTEVVQPGLLRGVTEGASRIPSRFLFTGIAAGLTVLMTAFLFFYLRRCPTPPSRRQGLVDEALGERLKKWPFYLINPRGRRRMIGRFVNPVFIKELRTMLFGRLVYLLRGMYFCVAISLALILLSAFSTYLYATRIIAIFTVSFQMALVLFLTPIFSGPLISSEIEAGRFDLLRLTKLKPLQIVTGKFQSVLLPLVIMMLATMPPYLALGYIDRALVPGILRSSATLGATLLFVCAAGIFFSSMARRTSTSVAATYIVVILMGVVSLVGLLARAGLSHSVLQTIFVINPVVAMLSEIAVPSLKQDFNLWLPNIYILLSGSAALLLAAAVRVHYLVRPR